MSTLQQVETDHNSAELERLGEINGGQAG